MKKEKKNFCLKKSQRGLKAIGLNKQNLLF